MGESDVEFGVFKLKLNSADENIKRGFFGHEGESS